MQFKAGNNSRLLELLSKNGKVTNKNLYIAISLHDQAPKLKYVMPCIFSDCFLDVLLHSYDIHGCFFKNIGICLCLGSYTAISRNVVRKKHKTEQANPER